MLAQIHTTAVKPEVKVARKIDIQEHLHISTSSQQKMQLTRLRNSPISENAEIGRLQKTDQKMNNIPIQTYK